jgi:hypothetical protein
MNPACQICRGACCESIIFPDIGGDPGRWLALHGRTLAHGQVELETRCNALNSCGTCAIHAARPRNCRDYAVGGEDCRTTVLRRRPAQAAEIFDLMKG